MKRFIHNMTAQILCLVLLGVCAENGGKKMASMDDVDNKRIGVYTGTIYDKFAVKRFPGATILRYNSIPDFVLALKNYKIDVAISNLYSAKNVIKTNPEIGILTDDVLSFDIGIGFNKNNPALRERFNRFIAQIKSDGSFEAMYQRWFNHDVGSIKMPQLEKIQTAEKVVLGVAIGDLPNAGYVNGEYVGFDIELVQTFAKNEKMNLEIITMEFGALIAALAAEKVDMIADCIAITEERKARVDFSDPYMQDKSAIIALNDNLENGAIKSVLGAEKNQPVLSFWQGVASSFYSNIILENRYLLILDGLKTTVIISLFSILFGTLLGAFICFLRMSKRKSLQTIAKLYISLLRGLPVLVLLMLIFYVVLAKVNIDPVFVAVIAFSLNFAAYVSEMFRTAIGSIDKGQSEAGIAGGFTKTQTFMYIVMPQAMQQVLPVYKGELINLVKTTSIVGYIAVQDLTKASDIIRSRTFDAFFPLIMTAVMYFAISGLLLMVLNSVEKRTEPKRRRKTSLINRRVVLIPVLIAAIVLAGIGVSSSFKKSQVKNETITSVSQLEGKRICVVTGTTGDFAVRGKINAKLLDMNYPADAALAVKTNKADAFVFDKSTLQYLVARSNNEFTIIPEKLAEADIVIPMKVSDKGLHKRINAAIEKFKQDGTLDSMYKKWILENENGTPPMPKIALDGENGTLRMGTSSLAEPFAFISNGEIVGFDIELAYRLAQNLGVKLEIIDISYDAMIMGLQAGKIDIAIANFYKMEERNEHLEFSIPYLRNDIVVLVRRAQL